ncbi:putative transcriptional regulator/transcriptional regulator with XRE-family HTH domain [Rhizobium sp. BIGb0125]|uniref:helix-turn-helix domain-containing protein n=1 Tax=Rhizobium sp. BIGb0125 TaxID=2940618 RepID=UPI0021682F7B|nr:XRE family transcriptional regulator [Rhizobium sp. BIGb0125]MCS4243432.1 putative transcriptional regulator/transcriptional regulator with XRE-family HTH domain [Rhizobium sp. BIGb0125]
MAENKIFAGPRVRRVRNGLGLTQTSMAEGLGISPSYLNLIERNQRPLTVQLLLKLASVYKIDLDELQGESGGVATQLREVFADPLLTGEVPSPQELVEVADAAPNVAGGIMKLYRAYREQAERLSDLAGLMARDGQGPSLSSARLPIDEVRDAFEHCSYYFAVIDDAAETFHEQLKPGDDLPAALKTWLQKMHGVVVRTLPIHAMPNLRRRYDRHSMRLFLSERLSPFDRLQEMAMEACLLMLQPEIQASLETLDLSSPEAKRLARFELARYAAHALIMPYGSFFAAAQRFRYDLDLLASRFQVSFEQVANRLVSLGRPGAPGIAFFLMEIDQAGNRFRKIGAHGFPHSSFGGLCPRLNIHAAFSQPGQLMAEAAEVLDGDTFLTIARTIEGPKTAFGERVRRTAILLACDITQGAETIYGDVARVTSGTVGIGVSCRLCERSGCLSRAQAPVTRPLGLDEMVTGLSVFDFQ